VQQNYSARNPHSSVTEALLAARAAGSVPSWPSVRGEDVGRSLAEMAQRDLDAALQLLADRAQFITGATGAAIALRRTGLNDMLCRASTGANAPELGALLSTEFGLSGESVRTKQLLRCDDAERDDRVNRDVCRHLGIASVVVMPVVHDDEVLGVFELFSGKTNAFGERDLSAMQRLGEMVETAVRLAQLTVALPESLRAHESSIAGATTAAPEEQVEDEILDVAAPDSNLAAPILSGESKHEEGDLLETDTEIVGFEPPAVAAAGAMAGFSVAGRVPSVEPSAENLDFSQNPDRADGKKPLLWSVPESAGDLETPEDSDQSHVPPVLRGLRKCEVCGFPISGGRVLCVECEEKRWRGQLKRTQPMPTGAIPHTVTAKNEGRSFAAAAPANAKPALPSSTMSVQAPHPTVPAARVRQVAPPSEEVSPGLLDRKDETVTEVTSSPVAAESVSSSFVLSSGLDDSQSWISSHKYVLGVMFLVALLAAFFLLR